MEITEEEIEQAPKIQALLESLEGGVPAVIEAMRFAEDPEIEAFLEEYDKASISDRKILPLEAFAIKADVDMPHFLGATILAFGQHCANIVKLMLPAAHPKVVKATIKYALRADGYRDRNTIHTALHLLPTSKGPTINFFTKEIDSGAQGIHPDDVDTDVVFPDLLKTQKLLED